MKLLSLFNKQFFLLILTLFFFNIYIYADDYYFNDYLDGYLVALQETNTLDLDSDDANFFIDLFKAMLDDSNASVEQKKLNENSFGYTSLIDGLLIRVLKKGHIAMVASELPYWLHIYFYSDRTKILYKIIFLDN